MPSPQELSKTERLKQEARPLRASKPPFYVQRPRGVCVLVGWWWQPNDASQPIPLAANYDDALVRVRELVTLHRHAAA